MLVSCSYCNGRHARGLDCKNKPVNNSRKKVGNDITRFRSSNAWQKKRLEIKSRDKFLCQACLIEKRYIFQKLEVHHITPISISWYKRLENDNLITLCSSCHSLAENGNITSRELLKIVQGKNAIQF